MSNKVDLNNIMKLFSIFTQKRWFEIDGHEDVLSKFGVLIENFNDAQVQLILELTERYTWVSYNDYHNQLRRLLKEVHKNSLSSKTKVYIFPIIKPEDEDENKSGHTVMYMVNSIKAGLNEYKEIEFVQLNQFSDLESGKMNITENDFLILVDDYIGTGNTLSTTIAELTKNETIKNNFAVLSVVIQNDTIRHLQETNIQHYYGISMDKGISNNYSAPILEEKIRTMEEIEKKIFKVKNYRFGYEKSEALVTLIRTPNNTFPIFWKECSSKGKTIDAPFPRY